MYRAFVIDPSQCDFWFETRSAIAGLSVFFVDTGCVVCVLASVEPFVSARYVADLPDFAHVEWLLRRFCVVVKAMCCCDVLEH